MWPWHCRQLGRIEKKLDEIGGMVARLGNVVIAHIEAEGYDLVDEGVRCVPKPVPGEETTTGPIGFGK